MSENTSIDTPYSSVSQSVEATCLCHTRHYCASCGVTHERSGIRPRVANLFGLHLRLSRHAEQQLPLSLPLTII